MLSLSPSLYLSLVWHCVFLCLCETKKKSEILVLHAEPNREAVQGGWRKREGSGAGRCAKLLPPKVKEIILAKRRRAKRFARNQHPYRLSDCLCVPESEIERERGGRGQVHPTNCQTESESEDEDEAELASNDRQDRMTFRGCCQLSLCCVFLFGFACVCSPHTHTPIHMRKKTLSTHTHTHTEEEGVGFTHSACPTQEASQ